MKLVNSSHSLERQTYVSMDHRWKSLHLKKLGEMPFAPGDIRNLSLFADTFLGAAFWGPPALALCEQKKAVSIDFKKLAGSPSETQWRFASRPQTAPKGCPH